MSWIGTTLFFLCPSARLYISCQIKYPSLFLWFFCLFSIIFVAPQIFYYKIKFQNPSFPFTLNTTFSPLSCPLLLFCIKILVGYFKNSRLVFWFSLFAELVSRFPRFLLCCSTLWMTYVCRDRQVKRALRILRQPNCARVEGWWDSWIVLRQVEIFFLCRFFKFPSWCGKLLILMLILVDVWGTDRKEDDGTQKKP